MSSAVPPATRMNRQAQTPAARTSAAWAGSALMLGIRSSS